MDTNILLESGTNELEILEFALGDNHYGINVAKIKEILQYSQVTPVPNAHPSVEGIFMPRDVMITVINLRRCLGMPDPEVDGLFIIDLMGKSAAKNKLKGKKVYTNFDKMFEDIVVDKFEDNTYVLDITHSCTHSYKKSIKGNAIIEKKLFIYADKITNITNTLSFHKGQFELVIEDIVKQISENITNGLIELV